MVKEYTTKFYIPALNSYKELSENSGNKAKLLEDWKNKVRNEWHNVVINNVDYVQKMNLDMHQPVGVKVQVKLGNLSPSDVEVQVYFGMLNHLDEITYPTTKVLKVVGQSGEIYHYEGNFYFGSGGVYGFTVRVLPAHPLLVSSPDMFLSVWAPVE